MTLSQFFKDEIGQLSLVRLISFMFAVNVICLSWKPLVNMELINGFLLASTGSKVGQKAVEMYFGKKSDG